jgi:WD40 repeat protein
VSSIAFSPDGELVLSGSEDGTLRLCRIDSGECLCILRGDGLPIYSIALSPDATLALSAVGPSIQVWHFEWELLPFAKKAKEHQIIDRIIRSSIVSLPRNRKRWPK